MYGGAQLFGPDAARKLGDVAQRAMRDYAPDAEEDGHCIAVAEALAVGTKQGTLPPFIGIRIKPLNEELRVHSTRTMELVLTELVQRAGALPENFVVTVPKIVILEQVEFVVREPPTGDRCRRAFPP